MSADSLNGGSSSTTAEPRPIYPPAEVTRLVLPRRWHDWRPALRQVTKRVSNFFSPKEAVEAETLEAPSEATDVPLWDDKPNGIGICLSGGGIRSAAYCLGALQAMGKEGMLFGDPTENECRATYLSAVSGGSYIATALTLVSQGPVVGAQRFGDHSIKPPTVPPVDPAKRDMRPFQPGTPEEKFVRNHTLYLTESKGGIPGTIWRAVLGLLLNTALMAWLVGTVTLPLGWLYGWAWPGLRADCPEPCGEAERWSVSTGIWLAVISAVAVAVLVGFLWISLRFRRDWRRTVVGAISGTFLSVTFLLLLLGVAIPEIIHLARPVHAMASSATATKQATVAGSSAGLLALALSWIAAARVMLSRASSLEKSAIKAAEGTVARYRTLAIKVVAFLGGPLLLFSYVTIVAYYGSGYPPGVSGSSGRIELVCWAVATAVLALIWRRGGRNDLVALPLLPATPVVGIRSW